MNIGNSRLVIVGLALVTWSGCSAAMADPSKGGKAAEVMTAPTSKPESVAAVGTSKNSAGFESFCSGWKDKLKAREKANLDKISWKREGSQVVGEYTAYDTGSTTTKVNEGEGKKSVPIGRLTYREMKLRLKGSSEVDALAQKPELVEHYEVTELFRMQAGKWVY